MKHDDEINLKMSIISNDINLIDSGTYVYLDNMLSLVIIVEVNLLVHMLP